MFGFLPAASSASQIFSCSGVTVRLTCLGCSVPSVEETTVDGILRSQVKYVQAYAQLRNHVQSCFRCQHALREEQLGP